MYIASSKKIKIFATGLKGLRVVQGVKQKTDQLFVIVGKDKNVKNDFSKEIDEFCKKENIPYSHHISDDNYDFGLAVAAGWQRMIYGIPSSALVIFHDSLLPRYRGFNPLVTALLNKDDFVGVTALLATDKYDCGEIIYQSKIPISYPILIGDAINKVGDLYCNIAKEIYSLFINEKLNGQPQNEALATYSLWRDDDDYAIDWSLDSEQIQLLVNSVGYPYLGASTYINGELVRVKCVSLVNDLMIENRDPGKIIFFDDKYPVVVCGKGLLRLISLETNDGDLFVISKIRTKLK